MFFLKFSSNTFRFLAGLMIIVQTGCTMHPPSSSIHTQLQKQPIAYIPLSPEIPVSLDIATKSRFEGALEKGSLGAIEFAASGSCTGSGICGLFLLSALALGYIAGGIYGAIVATPAKRAKDMEEAINKGVSSVAIQLDLPQKILKEVERYEWVKLDSTYSAMKTDTPPKEAHALWKELRQTGYGFLLQTQITHFEFVGGEGYDPELLFRLGVQAILIDLESMETVFKETFFHVSSEKKFSVWASGDSKMIKDVLERNVVALAQEIVDKLFLQTDLPLDSGMWRFPSTKRYGCCWLCPISPPYEVDYWPKVVLQYPVVESLTPLLEWEGVDEEFEQKATGSGGTESKVTYDLRIWEAFNDMKHDLVYEQTSLDVPKLQLKKPLKSHHRYFWSFRACASQQGFKSCTPWACSGIPSVAPALTEFDYCGSAVIQDWNYYRFATP